jgi:hypothetical protein
MGFKYRITNDELYFITITVVDWIDVFTRKELAEEILFPRWREYAAQAQARPTRDINKAPALEIVADTGLRA